MKVHQTVLRWVLGSMVLALLVACSTSATEAPAAEVSAPEATETSLPTATSLPTLVPTATVIPTATSIAMPDDLTVVPLVYGQMTGRPYAMMIDNHPDAYPQSGLNRASIVIEALAEYGITRYLAIFPADLTADDRPLGPVRSARIYFVQWAMGFGAFYAHAGGSPTGLALAESTNEIVNLDALRGESSPYFFRIETAERFAPHNLYTTGAILAERAAAESQAYTRTDVGYRYALPLPRDQRGPAASIAYYFLYDDAPVGWEYDPDTNAYYRTRFGQVAIDEVTQAQLSTQNVVVIEVEEAPIEGDDKSRIDQKVVGTGKGVFYHDGLREEVTWSKASESAPLQILGSDGSEVFFTAGQIWISAVPSLDNISEK